MTTEHQMALCANHWHKVAQSTMEALGAAQELLKTLYQNCGAAEAERDALRIECDDYKQTLGYIRGQEDKYQYRERHGFHRKIEFSEDGSTCEIVDTIEGQPVEYWHQVATSAMARNDTLISQLKEKEKTAAEQEQRITSLQNEILNRVYEGTQDWESKYKELAATCDQLNEIAADARHQRTVLSIELDEVKDRYKEDEEVYKRTSEEIKALRRDKITLLDECEKLRQVAEKASAPVNGKTAPVHLSIYQQNEPIRIAWDTMVTVNQLDTIRRSDGGTLYRLEFYRGGWHRSISPEWHAMVYRMAEATDATE